MVKLWTDGPSLYIQALKVSQNDLDIELEGALTFVKNKNIFINIDLKLQG